MGRAKGIHDINIAQSRISGGQLGIIFLFTLEKADVFQEINFSGPDFFGFVKIPGQSYRLAKHFGHVLGDRLERELFTELAFSGTAEMGQHDDTSAFLQSQLDGRQSCAHAFVIGNPAILHGNVEILPDDSNFPLQIERSHIFHCHGKAS